MKRFILATLCLSFICAYAWSGTPVVSKDDIEHMQAIVARRINIVSLANSCPELNALKVVPVEMLTMQEIRAAVDKIKNNRLLVDSIGQFKPQEGTNFEVAKSYYTDTIFESVLKDFFCRQERLDSVQNVKNDIEKEISQYWEKTHSKFQKKLSSQAGTNNLPEDNDKSVWQWLSKPFLKKVAIFMALFAAMAIVILYILYRKIQAQYENVKKEKAQLENKQKAQKQQINALQREKVLLEQELDDCKIRIEKLEKSSQKEEVCLKAVQQDDNRTESYAEPVPTEEIFYAVNCNNGAFTDICKSYSDGRFLYELIILGNAGTYKFINTPQTVSLVKDSRSEMIEQACNIVNDDTRSFNEVITETPGEIQYDGNIWRITRKAVVRLL